MKHNTEQCKDDCEEVKAFSEQLETLLKRDVAHQKRVIYLEARMGELEAWLAEKDGRIAALRMKLGERVD